MATEEGLIQIFGTSGSAVLTVFLLCVYAFLLSIFEIFGIFPQTSAFSPNSVKFFCIAENWGLYLKLKVTRNIFFFFFFLKLGNLPYSNQE